MLTKENIKFVNPGLKYSIKEYLPYDQKILLYDALCFLSIVSEQPMFCSSQDIASFKQLADFCSKTDISLANYLSIAYSYISKYSTSGHRIGTSYFLSENVVGFVANYIQGSTTTLLLSENIKDDLLITEKSIRSLLSDTVSYEKSFGIHLKQKKISDFFLAYKKYCDSPLLKNIETPYLLSLISILEPFFTHILARNHIYTPYKIKEWNNSKLEDFSFCPIYFKDRYITNELPESILGNEATRQGTRLHRIFEDILTKYKQGKTKNLKAIATRYFKSDTFSTLIEGLDDHIPYIKKVFLDTETSILHRLITPTTEIHLEYGMKSELLPTLTFYGTADCILINGTDAYILDWKSSKLDERFMDKNNAKYNKQISLYGRLLRSLRPEITSVTGIIVYTRGLTHTFSGLNQFIHEERGNEISTIKKVLKSGVLEPNTKSCFLCRSPKCLFRSRASIWNELGERKK